MRRTLLCLTTLLAVAAGPATQPTAHDRDPWVFRCVLDENARVLVVSLGQHVWAAYDTEHCTLAKIWVGDVDFTGAVFDTKHGPQPHARGTMLTDAPIPLQPAAPAATTRLSGGHVDGYRGYRIEGDAASVNFDFNGVTITDTLALVGVDANAKTITLRRTIAIDGSVSSDKPVTVAMPTSSRLQSIRLTAGNARPASPAAAAAAAQETLSAPADLDAANDDLVIAAPERLVVEMTFDASPASR